MFLNAAGIINPGEFMETLIAYRCAPALIGIKPANTVSVNKLMFNDVGERLTVLNNQLNIMDIYFDVLNDGRESVLIMAYRKKMLEQTLMSDEAKIFLNSFGYPYDSDVLEKIDYLRARISGTGFPHEIGVFLGYPIHDILGFMYNKDNGCLLCGEWKVYREAERAEELFRRFNSCRVALCKKVLCGQSLAQIFAQER